MTAERTVDYDYRLDGERIARYPTPRRDGSRLLWVRRGDGPPALEDLGFRDLVARIPPGDALVLNDSRVLPARLRGRKPTGAEGEVLLLRPLPDPPGERRWEALVRPGDKLKPGRRLRVGDGLEVAVEEALPDGGRIVRLVGEGETRELLERHGEMPIPPYLGRRAEPVDRERYQTVYAREPGSVAAPTAGLHFTPGMLEALRECGVRVVRLTLHVGVGTFRPVEAERPSEHTMHEEPFWFGEEAATELNEVRASGGAVWAVGTTVTRTLETVVDEGGRFRAAEGRTDIFLRPPWTFRGVDRLVTNFHLPRSTLLMLVCAFAGRERTLRAYRHAMRAGYRFYSYGDVMAVV